MQLVVISKEDFFSDEADYINRLFEEGMTSFHLRKPNASIQEIQSLLSSIDSNFLKNISLHQYHSLAPDYGIKRLHFTEANRLNTSREQLDLLRKSGYTLSTSVHSMENLQDFTGLFDYIFYSPVFDSISKSGYKSNLPANFKVNDEYQSIQTIALGGINSLNIKLVKEMKFNGAAVLGSLWQNPENAVSEFLKLKECYQ